MLKTSGKPIYFACFSFARRSVGMMKSRIPKRTSGHLGRSFFPEDLSYGFLTVRCYVRCELCFCLHFGGRLSVVPARVLPPWWSRSAIGKVVREHDSGCPGAQCEHYLLGCAGARFWLSGSTILVVRGHDSGCPGARLSITC